MDWRSTMKLFTLLANTTRYAWRSVCCDCPKKRKSVFTSTTSSDKMKAALIAILMLVAITTICARLENRLYEDFEERGNNYQYRPAKLADYIMKRACGSGCGAGKCVCPVGKQVGHACWCEFPKAQPFNEPDTP
ncbi:hypothetical protein ACROYT_G040111 [Oculina patagonica]